jgi:hypothetical protein
MTSRDPGDPPRTFTHPVLRFFIAVVVALTIVAIIALFNALNRGPVERTGAGPSHHAVST